MAWIRASRSGIPACRTGVSGCRVDLRLGRERKSAVAPRPLPGAITRLSPAKYRPLERSPVHHHLAASRSAPSGSSRRSGRSPVHPSRMDGEWRARADGRACQPRLGKNAAARSCATAPAGGRSCRRAMARTPAARSGPRSDAHCAFGQIGRAARLTPKPTTTRSPLRSSRIPASFRAEQQHVVGPFEHQRLRRARQRRSLRSGRARRRARGSARGGSPARSSTIVLP